MIRAKLNRSAKIVATLGPASDSVETISDLILAGLNVARLNMSHGTHKGHAQLIANIREASQLVGLEVAILMDLQGPKIRVDELEKDIRLKKGEKWLIGPGKVKKEYPEDINRFIPAEYKNLVNDCDEGDRILFDDGLIRTEVIERNRNILKIKVLSGGILKSKKGMNLPDSRVSAPSFTKKDREDLLFGIENGVDYIALSFVRKKGDVIILKNMLKELDKDIPIVSKIENPEAIENIDEIVEISDVIMVARGDMGVEIGNHLVPAVQKKIISLCNSYGVPVITATQMLESMVENTTPTRAEASDVANAIWDGTDAVMLSAETASGKHPFEAIKIMGKIIKEAEKTPKERASMKERDLTLVDSAIMIGASLIAEKIDAKRILSVTESGSSCLKISALRPCTSVLGVSSSLYVVRKMCLYWGVSPYFLDEYDKDNRELEQYVIDRVRTACELESGDKIVITRGGGQFFERGTSNSIKVVTIT